MKLNCPFCDEELSIENEYYICNYCTLEDSSISYNSFRMEFNKEIKFLSTYIEVNEILYYLCMSNMISTLYIFTGSEFIKQCEIDGNHLNEIKWDSILKDCENLINRFLLLRNFE
jgi:hypothetical protein